MDISMDISMDIHIHGNPGHCAVRTKLEAECDREVMVVGRLLTTIGEDRNYS